MSSAKGPRNADIEESVFVQSPNLDDPYAGPPKLRFGLVAFVGSGVLQQQVKSSSAGVNALPVANDQLVQTRDGRAFAIMSRAAVFKKDGWSLSELRLVFFRPVSVDLKKTEAMVA